MTDLAAYQQRIALALGDPGDDYPGAAVMRWSIEQWAGALLRFVCPLTSTLLLLRGRYADDVRAQLATASRPASIHAWGRYFLRELTADPDPEVADVALLELLLSAPPAHQPELPANWVWWRSPSAVALSLAQGLDPRAIPPLELPLCVIRAETGEVQVSPTATAATG